MLFATQSLCDGMPRLFMQSVEMTLKNPEDNRHQLPGSGDQQAAVKGWILGVTTGTTVPDHRRTNSSLDCTFTLRYFCACKTGIQLIL